MNATEVIIDRYGIRRHWLIATIYLQSVLSHRAPFCFIMALILKRNALSLMKPSASA